MTQLFQKVIQKTRGHEPLSSRGHCTGIGVAVQATVRAAACLGEDRGQRTGHGSSKFRGKTASSCQRHEPAQESWTGRAEEPRRQGRCSAGLDLPRARATCACCRVSPLLSQDPTSGLHTMPHCKGRVGWAQSSMVIQGADARSPQLGVAESSGHPLPGALNAGRRRTGLLGNQARPAWKCA